ncbi:hypothetical protein ACTXM3_08545 [Glutamicibacter arilaitensis]|uniref:hypothetical protein n=1 Tax=Glutamicibacter arilaitensis TaxID=256701 RepID=UPI003FD06D5B
MSSDLPSDSDFNFDTAAEVALLSAKYALKIARAEHTATLNGIQTDDIDMSEMALHVALQASMEASEFMGEGCVLEANISVADISHTKLDFLLPEWWDKRPHIDQIGIIAHVDSVEFSPEKLVQELNEHTRLNLKNADGTTPLLSTHHIIFLMESQPHS